jgi:two-component system, cell cycle sensor histidine kinase and response regulator CckA
MKKIKILVVEDELIVAEDLRKMLKRLGYEVVGMAASGEEAIRIAESTAPDLVLMDIRIQGPMDGIEVAEHIYTHLDVPVSYLTAYADEPTLERAKATMPFGYVLKPFEEHTLRTTIELALYRHDMNRVLKKMDDWHASTLNNLAEAVLAADALGRVFYVNRAAEEALGKPLHELAGKPLSDYLSSRQEGERLIVTLAGRPGRYVGLMSSDGPGNGTVWSLRSESPAAVPSAS